MSEHRTSSARAAHCLVASVCLFWGASVSSASAQDADGGVAPPASDAGIAPAAETAPVSEPVPAPESAPEPAAVHESEHVSVPESEPVAPAEVSSGIDGVVTDAETHEPIIEGTVTVVQNGRRATTDIDGIFAIDLPPGTYTLRSFYELHQAARVENLTVRAGARTRIEIALEPDRESTQEVVVTARADRSTAATQLQIRRNATSVQDAVSAQEISRTPDATASDAVRRVVAASIVDGQYLFVRGLGGRYTNVLLNGSPLPSTDPDLAGVQLDIFPAALLDSLTIVKTFSPELPGDFAGGLMLLDTRSYPERFTATTSIGTAFNTQSTFRSTLGYEGGSLDWLGIDDGTRAMPSGVPDVRVDAGRGLTSDQVNAIARQFPNHWNVTRSTALPDLTLNASIGDTLDVGGHRLGYLVSFGYQATTRTQIETLRRLRVSGAQLEVAESMQQEGARQNVLWGALGTLTYEPAHDHEISLVAMYSRNSTDYTGLLTGLSESEGLNVSARRLQFVERSLVFAQLLGDHHGNMPLDMRLRWQVYGSLAFRDEPDTRDVLYTQGPLGLQWKSGPGSGERFYGSLLGRDVGGRLDLTFPIGASDIRAGTYARATDRAFESRRFAYDFRGSNSLDRYLGPEELFSPDRVGSTTRFLERTLASDGYVSNQELIAGYAMTDLHLADPVRVVLGARVEAAHQSLSSSSPFASMTGPMPRGSDRDDVDVLPAANAIFRLSETMAIRASYGATVARPQARELAPFVFADFVRRRTVQGNPDLSRTFIHNADVRWELFPSENEVVSASLFYKNFRHPIEQTILDDNGNITFQNVDGATNYGAELEARLSLGRITRALDAFTFGTNFTFVYSRVSLSPEQRAVATNSDRALAGQSPWVANLSLGLSPHDSPFSTFLYYNVFGPRIQDVGSLGLPDVYERPFHQLDLVMSYRLTEHFTLRVTAKNLLFQTVGVEQGDVAIREFNPGTTFAIKLGWTD
ncbi:MAG: TonB-dependent receptor [Sandaracinaceae bacterium]|nr:TonB-dependent receptor [Sandaracinaceae bacterium]